MLLGEIPPSAYEIPPTSDELPELPLEDAHPYHIVVFAAQECPSASGMPRGLGGSLMKGVGLQKSDAARRERDDKKEEQGEKRRQEKEAEKDTRKAIREIRKEFLERSANLIAEKEAEKDALKALKELRKEYKEREGPAASLKDLIDKDKNTKEREKDVKIPGLGVSLSGLTEDLLEKSKAAVMGESSSDNDSSASRTAQASDGDTGLKVGGTMATLGPGAVAKASAVADPTSNGAADQDNLVSVPASNVVESQGGVAVPTAADVPPRITALPATTTPPSNGTARLGGVVNGDQTDTPLTSSNGDCAPSGSVPPKPKPVHELKELNGEQLPPAAQTPSQQVKEKPSREQLRIDPVYRRKADSRDTVGSARSYTAFDIGLGSPMSDLAGSIGRKGWSGMLEGEFASRLVLILQNGFAPALLTLTVIHVPPLHHLPSERSSANNATTGTISSCLPVASPSPPTTARPLFRTNGLHRYKQLQGQ